jgi:hypothetical protein
LHNSKTPVIFTPHPAIIALLIRLSFDGQIRLSNPEQPLFVHLINLCTFYEKVLFSIWFYCISNRNDEFLRFHEKRLPG